MQLPLLAFYAGPDQVMGVTSGIAGAIGVLLMFWNKVVGTFHKLVNKFRGSPAEPSPAVPPKENPTSQA
jgi:hypothetical protein